MSEIAACPMSPFANSPSALPSPTSTPSSSQELLLPSHLMPAPVCQLLYFTTALGKVLYSKVKNVFLVLFVFMYLCEKDCKPGVVQWYIAACVNWVPTLTHSYVGDLMHMLHILHLIHDLEFHWKCFCFSLSSYFKLIF